MSTKNLLSAALVAICTMWREIKLRSWGSVLSGKFGVPPRFLVSIAFLALLAGPGMFSANARSFSGAVLYVANDDGTIWAYEIGTWQLLGYWTGLPFRDGVRGIGGEGDYLYVAHGGDGGTGASGATGHLLKWDMTSGRVVYDVAYAFGIDQFAVCNGTIYMPVGELANSSTWEVILASTGHVTGTLKGGSHPHNTICRNGIVYMGGRQSNYLYMSAGPLVGPSPSTGKGVRPFTINASGSRTWITWTAFRGFSVGNTQTGAILATVNFGPIPSAFKASSASHGVSLNPAATEVYVLDTPYRRVQVYDATARPTHLATISIPDGLTGSEYPCPYDCQRTGWLLHSLDGRYVFVGDSGDVIDTATRVVVINIPPMLNNKHGFIEVDWVNGVPTVTSTHSGMGY